MQKHRRLQVLMITSRFQVVFVTSIGGWRRVAPCMSSIEAVPANTGHRACQAPRAAPLFQQHRTHPSKIARTKKKQKNERRIKEKERGKRNKNLEYEFEYHSQHAISIDGINLRLCHPPALRVADKELAESGCFTFPWIQPICSVITKVLPGPVSSFARLYSVWLCTTATLREARASCPTVRHFVGQCLTEPHRFGFAEETYGRMTNWMLRLFQNGNLPRVWERPGGIS